MLTRHGFLAGTTTTANPSFVPALIAGSGSTMLWESPSGPLAALVHAPLRSGHGLLRKSGPDGSRPHACRST